MPKTAKTGVVSFLVFNLDRGDEHQVNRVKAMTAMGAAKKAYETWGSGTFWIALESDVTVISAEYPTDVSYRVVTSNVTDELSTPDKP